MVCFLLLDINECLMNGICKNAECLNTRGSYRCTCKPGYMLDPARSHCVCEYSYCLPVTSDGLSVLWCFLGLWGLSHGGLYMFFSDSGQGCVGPEGDVLPLSVSGDLLSASRSAHHQTDLLLQPCGQGLGHGLREVPSARHRYPHTHRSYFYHSVYCALFL